MWSVENKLSMLYRTTFRSAHSAADDNTTQLSDLNDDLLAMIIKDAASPITIDHPEGKIDVHRVTGNTFNCRPSAEIKVGDRIFPINIGKVIEQHMTDRPRLFTNDHIGEKLQLKISEKSLQFVPPVPGFTDQFGLFITEMNGHLFAKHDEDDNVSRLLKYEPSQKTIYNAIVQYVTDDTVEFYINDDIKSVKVRNPKWKALPRTTFRVRVGHVVPRANSRFPPQLRYVYLTLVRVFDYYYTYTMKWKLSTTGEESIHEPQFISSEPAQRDAADSSVGEHGVVYRRCNDE
jgi:hypothetical protein